MYTHALRMSAMNDVTSLDDAVENVFEDNGGAIAAAKDGEEDAISFMVSEVLRHHSESINVDAADDVTEIYRTIRGKLGIDASLETIPPTDE